ncbi:hypothetical protein NEMBOFW57_002235 [Staphylotrichum longicolle]|uniref:Uncharacterized protein n=1 Tax=Staphylotrichum longicolle TaxID=669026 RepID=A0AAD4I3F3_9PEZI|nr:hypothetical protein NEMBOFW57_002235 [Staphylotrichum longicolle]
MVVGPRPGTSSTADKTVKDQSETDATTTITPSSSCSLPTKWRPWKVALGCFLLTVPTYGLLSAIGLFQTYWRAGLLAGRSEADVAWLTSLFGFLDCLFAAPAGYLFDRARTVSSANGSRKRKGLRRDASRWAPLGGIFFSLVLQSLFDRFSWRTAALILTGIMAALLVLGVMLVETNTTRQETAGEENPEPPARVSDVLKSSKFWLISYALFAYELVLFIQWGSIPSYAVAANVGDKQFYLMMSYNVQVPLSQSKFFSPPKLNICSGAILGRTIPPWLSDRVMGPLNATIMMNIFTLFVVLAIWLPLGGLSVAALFVVVVLMGIGTGSFVPLGAVILERYHSEGLLAFLAAVLFSGMISATALRWLFHGRQWVWRVRV